MTKNLCTRSTQNNQKKNCTAFDKDNRVNSTSPWYCLITKPYWKNFLTLFENYTQRNQLNIQIIQLFLHSPTLRCKLHFTNVTLGPTIESWNIARNRRNDDHGTIRRIDKSTSTDFWIHKEDLNKSLCFLSEPCAPFNNLSKCLCNLHNYIDCL